jgi:aspartyl/asparaginyl beta-hydroxylase (cupin superfamily)
MIYLYIASEDNEIIISDYTIQDKLFYTTQDLQFQKLKYLEHNYKTILSEIPTFDINKVKIKRNPQEWIDKINSDTFNKIKNCDTWIEGWDENKFTWYNYPLLAKGTVMCDTATKCPKTLQLLKMSGLKINVAGFALLLPNTKLMVHTDPTGVSTNTAAFNLFLKGTDSSLYIKKNEEFVEYKHQDGKAVIFNSELQHYADNNSTDIRYILYMDISYA